MPDLQFFGRRKIFSTCSVIDETNVIEEVNKALMFHFCNLAEEDYLYWYRRGICPILERKKEIRPEICNKVVIPNADYVCTFKNGYFLTDSISYIARKAENADKVAEYNEYIHLSGRDIADNQTVDNFHTMGLGVEYVEPDRGESTSVPYHVYALDPRSAFVVYSMRPGNPPLMGVNMVVETRVIDDVPKTFCKIDVFTQTNVYRLSGYLTGNYMTERPSMSVQGVADSIDSTEINVIGEIPIVEFVYNGNRMSAFENAITIMDAINLAESNRLDGDEQAVQQLCVAYNCNFEEGTTANTIRQAGMIVLKSTSENKADFKILDSQLDQTATQTMIDDLYDQMLEKCGVPSSTRDAASTSDNVGAVFLRNGWGAADTACRNTEDYFRESNRLMDKIILAILKRKGFVLDPSDIDIVIHRADMSNMVNKTQAAMNLKELGLSPELVLKKTGISSDPIADVNASKKYIDIHWAAPQMYWEKGDKSQSGSDTWNQLERKPGEEPKAEPSQNTAPDPMSGNEN